MLGARGLAHLCTARHVMAERRRAGGGGAAPHMCLACSRPEATLSRQFFEPFGPPSPLFQS
eukprot:11162628-Alexandrium_andersonii.AAC.1